MTEGGRQGARNEAPRIVLSPHAMPRTVQDSSPPRSRSQTARGRPRCLCVFKRRREVVEFVRTQRPHCLAQQPRIGGGLEAHRVDEDRRTGIARPTLQRKRDEVAEPSARQRVLAREKPVVRRQRQASARPTRFGDQRGPQRTRPCSADCLCEEDPQVSASTRAGNLDERRKIGAARNVGHGPHIVSPGRLVEIDRHEPAGFILPTSGRRRARLRRASAQEVPPYRGRRNAGLSTRCTSHGASRTGRAPSPSSDPLVVRRTSQSHGLGGPAVSHLRPTGSAVVVPRSLILVTRSVRPVASDSRTPDPD